MSNINVVGIKELLFDKTGRTFPKLPNWSISPWDSIDHNSVDVYVQTNQAGGPTSKSGKRYGRLYQQVIETYNPFLVVEGPVFRENHPLGSHPNAYQRWSWLSYFNNEGDYNNENCPSDRWLQVKQRQNLTVRDWRNNGEHILLMLQRPGDSSLKNLIELHGTYEKFVHFTIEQIRKNTDRTIIVRPHPQRLDRQLPVINNLNFKNIKISQNISVDNPNNIIAQGGAGLYRDLENCWAAVGFNSNALTESAMYGIPTYSMCPSSMAWPVSNSSLSTINNPPTPDRDQWLYNLAYCQWTNEEVQIGLPWFHLEPKYYEIKNKLDKLHEASI